MALAVLAALTLVRSGPVARAQVDNDEGGLRLVGQMARPDDPQLLRPMGVDDVLSLGFVAGANLRLYMFDLGRLVSLGSTEQRDEKGATTSYTPEGSLALDPVRERLYATATYPATEQAANNSACGIQPATVGTRQVPEPVYGLPVFDYSTNSAGQRALVQKRMGPMPCTGKTQFFGLANSYDRVHDLLYIGGVPATERWRYLPSTRSPVPSFMGGTLEEDRGQVLLVRQLTIGKGPLLPFDLDPSRAYGQGAAQFRLDWEVDLRVAGCGRRDHRSEVRFEGFVARLGDEVLAYCWDARPYRGLSVGQQGYLVRIPLVDRDGVAYPLTHGAPVTDPVTGQVTNYVYRRAPTLPGNVTPIFDQVSGRVMLVTTGATNGNAVWVFDPRAERFVGVITGGYSDEPAGHTAVGFDSTKGRVYVLTKNGILVAPVRQDPLPAGLVYPVLTSADRNGAGVSSNRISVAPALGRLFVPVGSTYQILEDAIPDPPAIEPVDPDDLTTQTPEVQGKTTTSTSGQAIAMGAHLVNTGGLPRAIGQNDPTCVFSPPNRQIPSSGETVSDVPDWEIAPALVGGCLADLVVSPGHREASVASAEVEASTGGGATGRGSAFGFGSNDAGTDGDIRRFSDCAADAPDRVDGWARRWPFPDDARTSGDQAADPVFGRKASPPFDKEPYENQYNGARDGFWNHPDFRENRDRYQEQYRVGCNDFQEEIADGGGPDLRAGTKGGDGRGFPVPVAMCGDFGGAPDVGTWPEESAGQPQAAYPASSAMCDASRPRAQSAASLGGLAVPTSVDPRLSVARTWSKVTTERTAEGQITVAFSVAEGVAIPEAQFSIAQVRSLAVSRTHGHKDTAKAMLMRQWCGLAVADQTEPGCVDADSPDVKALLDEINAALLQKVQLSVPQASKTASPGGYQAVVTKHPGQRGADQTVNDDDTHTVSALQAIIYNDGPRGRSRLVVQLAGVHAESRYGIIELPDFSSAFGVIADEPVGDEAGNPSEPPLESAAPDSAAQPDTFTPANFVDDPGLGGVDEVVRANDSAREPLPRTVPRATTGSRLTRVVRVPVQALSDAIRLLVQNPREAALLFLMWALLATPAYLGLRRRSFARTLAVQ